MWWKELSLTPISTVEGGNFELAFLKISPQATLPALVTPDGQLYDSTIKVTRYLIENAPEGAKVGKPTGDLLLELVHEDKIDPNFFMLAVRNEEELKTKSASVPGLFLRSRTYISENVDLQRFY
jgi:hypothetical protein